MGVSVRQKRTSPQALDLLIYPTIDSSVISLHILRARPFFLATNLAHRSRDLMLGSVVHHHPRRLQTPNDSMPSHFLGQLHVDANAPKHTSTARLVPMLIWLVCFLPLIHLPGCASTQHNPPFESGVIESGGRLGSAGDNGAGLNWSMLLKESHMEFQINDTSVLLQGFGSEQPVQYTHSHTTPPGLTFTSEGRPDIWWHGYELRIGSKIHYLERSRSYLVGLDGVLRSK